MGLVDWYCSSCTYYHKSPGNRCVMCGNLRGASKQEMRDFIQGKTLKQNDQEQQNGDASNEGNLQSIRQPPISQTTIDNPGDRNNAQSSSVVKSPPTNPYAAQRRRCNNPYSKRPVLDDKQLPQQQYTMPRSSSISGPTHPMTTTQRMQPQTCNLPYHQDPKYAMLQNIQNTIPPNIVTNHGPSINTFFHPDQNSTNNEQQKNALDSSNNNSSKPSSNGSTKSNNIAQYNNPFDRIRRPQSLVYSPGPIPFDPKSSSKWIYPIHEKYPIRDYQFEITKTAISYNTMVSLPTGLGKTLIAAVVLYNFYRWFPKGKVVFLAPTLPLVDQQVRACYQIMGIPARDTAVLNGKVSASNRSDLWKERRVFFCTPQTVQRDIDAGRCPAESIVCLVLDEAHKATGNFAYTKVVEQCEMAQASLRILALSATPGAKVEQVQKVVTALRIQKLEARTEEDVSQYRHERHQEIVLVKNRTICRDIGDALTKKLIEPLMTKLRSSTNIRQRIGPTDAALTSYCIHRGRLHHWETTTGAEQHRYDGYFAAAQKLIDARANLHSHGIGSVRVKLLQLQNNPQRGILSTLVKSQDFTDIIQQVLQASGGNEEEEVSAKDKVSSNPKLKKLVEILDQHFARSKACGENTTRAIVFSQWRESVNEIVSVLATCQPTIRPRHFVGQGTASSKNKSDTSNIKGMPQKMQQQVIREFQSGHYNVLVCTCIGEEGLDIGEVDLIVNYDTLRSPIRMIQRVGRTGRKRKGRVVCLVSEGQEEKDWKRGQANERTLQRALRRPENFQFTVLPSLFPSPPEPEKQIMHVNETFPLSQVGGHGGAPKISKTNSPLENWKLSKREEEIRLCTFGPIRCSTDDPRRKWLRARRGASATSYAQKLLAGPSRRLVLTMEATASIGIVASNTDSTRRRKRTERLDIWEDDEYYCSTLKEDWEEEASDRIECAFPTSSDTKPESTSASSKTYNQSNLEQNVGKKKNKVAETASSSANQVVELNVTNPSSDSFDITRRVSSSTRASSSSSNTSHPPLRINPYSQGLNKNDFNQATGSTTNRLSHTTDRRVMSSIRISNDGDNQGQSCTTVRASSTGLTTTQDQILNHADDNAETNEQITTLPILNNEVTSEKSRPVLRDVTDLRLNSDKCETTVQRYNDSFKRSASILQDCTIPVKEGQPLMSAEPMENASHKLSATIEFRLPTPPASSSSESESDDETDSDDERPIEKSTIKIEIETLHPSIDDMIPSEVLLTNQKDGFVHQANESMYSDENEPNQFHLPTQDSSSDESSNEDCSLQGGSVTNIGGDPAEDKNVCDEDLNLNENRDQSNTNDINQGLIMDSKCTNKDIERNESRGLKDVKVVHEYQEVQSTESTLTGKRERTNEAGISGTPSRHKQKVEHHSYLASSEMKLSEGIANHQERTSTLGLDSKVSTADDLLEKSPRRGFKSLPFESPRALRKRLEQSVVVKSVDETPKSVRPAFDYQVTDYLVDTPSVNGEATQHKNQLSCSTDSDTPYNPKVRELKHPTQLVDTPVGQESPSRFSNAKFECQATDDLVDTPSVTCQTMQNKTPGSGSIDTATPYKPKLQDLRYPERLLDTPNDRKLASFEIRTDNVEDIVCQVCHCGDSPDDDPIVFCDGPNNCPVAVHTSCYSLDPSVINLMDKWLCDLCTLKSKSNFKPSCFVCQRHDCTLKKLPDASWIHPYCMSWSDDDAVSICQFCSFPGATACGVSSCSQVAHPHCARNERNWLTIVDTQKKQNFLYCPEHRSQEYSGFGWIPHDEESILPKCFLLPSSRATISRSRKAVTKINDPRQKKRLKKLSTIDVMKKMEREDCKTNEIESKEARRIRVREALTKRHQGMLESSFIDTDAIVEKNGNMTDNDDDENSEVRRIDEEEELAALSFINDLQLDYTQDDLGRVDPSVESQTLHRLVDVEKERKKQFATPILNRRMARGRESQNSETWGSSSRSDNNNRSSLKGLGNCHFIRSVIEHARQGGDAEDIEAAYHETVANMTQESTNSSQHQPIALEYASSSDDEVKVQSKAKAGLTVDQRAAIEQRRSDALARRKNKR